MHLNTPLASDSGMVDAQPLDAVSDIGLPPVGRTGLYQSSGAFSSVTNCGVLALLHSRVDIARAQILEAPGINSRQAMYCTGGIRLRARVPCFSDDCSGCHMSRRVCCRYRRRIHLSEASILERRNAQT